MAGSNGGWRFDHSKTSTKQCLLPMGTPASYELGRARGYLNLWRVLIPRFASQGVCMAVVNSDICYFQMHYKAELEYMWVGLSTKASCAKVFI